VVVTRKGDRCAGGVWRSGGSQQGVTGSALAEAGARVTHAVAAAEAAARGVAQARQALDQARQERGQAQKELEANLARGRSAAGTLARARAEGDDTEQESVMSGAQRQETAARLAREQARVAELEQQLPELDRAAAMAAQRADAERAERSRLADRVSAVAALRRDLEVRAAGLEERRGLLTRRLAEVEARLRRNVAEREAAAGRRLRLERVARATDRLSDLVAARSAQLDQTVDWLRVTRREEAEATRALADRLERLRRERAAAERQLAELREHLSRVELDEAEAKVRLEALTESVRRDLDMEPEATRAAECPELPPGTSATSRRSELERELRLMGPINPLALEEHTALQERHQFLEAQLEDVRAGRRELAKVIRAVDAEIVETFRAAFADVADNFEKLFATLFPGGEGRLRLTDPEALLETGIEVEARPSGKNVRRLSLLSGGERSLTAMAFLFAVFRARPSPFYLMDEVEAALDDVNLHRFLELLHEFRGEAQLVVVSHQKRTMEAADCLYGVTMAPGGSSRVVSERVSTSPSSS
jgi:chromosome segregation protein